jgi:hypothetical protein
MERGAVGHGEPVDLGKTIALRQDVASRNFEA